MDTVYNHHVAHSLPGALPGKASFCAMLRKSVQGTTEKGASIVLFSTLPDTGKTTLVHWVRRVFESSRVLLTPDSMNFTLRYAQAPEVWLNYWGECMEL